MRTRKNVVTIRMNDAEYGILKDKVRESGLTQQSFIIRSISGASIPSAGELTIQKEISRTLADLVRQLRGLSTNVNQIAHVANGWNILPGTEELAAFRDEIAGYRKESENLWQSIRSSISQQSHTEQ